MTRADILGCASLATAEVKLPDGKTASVRELNAGERGEVIRLFKENKNIAEIHARIIVMGAQDNGKAVFNEKDVSELLKLPGRVVQSLADRILELSAMGGDDSKKE